MWLVLACEVLKGFHLNRKVIAEMGDGTFELIQETCSGGKEETITYSSSSDFQLQCLEGRLRSFQIIRAEATNGEIDEDRAQYYSLLLNQ